MSNPKIIYPSQPLAPAAPGLTQQAGGTQAARTEFFKITYVTADGETLASAEASIAVLINKVAVVASPAQLASPYVATGYNVYQSASGGQEKLVTATRTAIGASTVEPNGGWIQDGSPPATWGATLTFQRAPRFVPNAYKRGERVDTVSLAGLKQSIFFRSDVFLEFEMEWVAKGSDADNWSSFMDSALQGKLFDYYPDASLGSPTTYTLEDSDFIEAYKSLGMFTFKQKYRKLVA